MPIEQSPYADLADRLKRSREAARSLTKRLPRQRGNDGKTLVAVDLTEIRHKPPPPGHRVVIARTLSSLATPPR